MATSPSIAAIILASLLIVFGIIHLGVGIGITAKYRKYSDIFRQSESLAIFDIVVGIYAIATGIIGLIAVIRQNPALSRIAAICTLVLGVVAFASLITALALNSQAIGYIRSRLAYRINTYDSIDTSISIVNLVQTNYQCCGEYSWLDWATIALGASTSTGTSSGGTSITNGRRRRRYVSLESSPLIEAVRQRRQVTSGTTSTGLYGLPSSYSINLPLSCCIGGAGAASTTGNTIGGYCVFNAGNSTNNFYVGGCIAPVANIVVSQITGIAVINICLAILAFVFIPILAQYKASVIDDPNAKQSLPNDMQQPPMQVQNGGYYMDNSNPMPYNAYPGPVNTVPAYDGAAYTIYR